MNLEIVSDVEELVEDETLKGEMVAEMGKLEEPFKIQGRVIVCAEVIPSWLLLTNSWDASTTYLYVEDECRWFRRSLEQVGKMMVSLEWRMFWESEWTILEDSERTVFIQGSYDFCVKVLDKLKEVMGVKVDKVVVARVQFCHGSWIAFENGKVRRTISDLQTSLKSQHHSNSHIQPQGDEQAFVFLQSIEIIKLRLRQKSSHPTETNQYRFAGALILLKQISIVLLERIEFD